VNTEYVRRRHHAVLVQAVKKLESRINSDLASMNEWLNANRLSLNATKTEYMLIGSAPRINRLTAEPVLYIGNTRLKRVKFKKTLGVILDENLGWHDHIENIAKKVKRCISVLIKKNP
jgi:hypothetical protein